MPRRIHVDLRLRGKFVLALAFVLLLGAVLLGLLGLPHIDRVQRAQLETRVLHDLSIEAYETLETKIIDSPLDAGVATLHMRMPESSAVHESDLGQILTMRMKDGALLVISDAYTPEDFWHRSASRRTHLPLGDFAAAAEAPCPSVWELLISGRRTLTRWAHLGEGVRLGRFPTGALWRLDTSAGTALVACAKDDHVGRPERAYSLEGRWWARDGSISFEFVYHWPKGAEPFDLEACLEKARDIVSRIDLPQHLHPRPTAPRAPRPRACAAGRVRRGTAESRLFA